MNAFAGIARASVLSLVPYSPARGECAGAEVLLDANESAWPPFKGGSEDLNRYPDPQPAALRRALARLYRVPEASLFIGRGTDEAIDSLVRVFCEAGENDIVVCPPTYGMYEVSARIQGAGVRAAPLNALKGYALDAKAVAAVCDDRVRLVFLCSPNNPTGNGLDPDSMLRVCGALEGKAVVVADEAYIEFSGRRSLADRAGTVRNLVVLRTLSKARALAGVRLGAAVGHPDLVALLQKVRAPYPIPRTALDPALKALSPEGRRAAEARVKLVKSERKRLAAALSRCKEAVEVLPSDANFILVRCRDSRALLKRCAAEGVRVRDRGSEPSLTGCVRITVGRPQDNDRLLRALGAGGG